MLQLTTAGEMIARAQRCVDDVANGRSAAEVLDAGSGLGAYVTFAPHVTVVGVDVDPELLERNKRLDMRVLADLETWEPERQFDCVICWEVLEHLRDPADAVRRLAAAVRPGGALIVGSPNPHSLKGAVTKWTPQSFHELAYRRFYGKDHTGEPGTRPYRTFMRRDVAPRRVAAVAARAGLHLESLQHAEAPIQTALRRRLRLVGGPWSTLRRLVAAVTGGRFDLAATDYVAIFRRADAATSDS